VARKKVIDSRKLSEMKNLGPACEQDLNAAGIFTAEDLKAAGVEGAFLRVLEARRANSRSTKCCNAAYLYAIYGAVREIDWRDIPEKKKQEFKAFTAELRESGRFR
jgi:DNA transformation protein and related proteins